MPKFFVRRTVANDSLQPLVKPIYVLRMNADRMSNESLSKWLTELRSACEETIKRVNGYIGDRDL